MPAKAQHIQFCTARDGVRLAYAVTGRGAPLVRVSTWLSHIEYEWDSPIRRPTFEALSRSFSLVRYDQRGCGLSDRDVRTISFEAWIEDLETVLAAAGLRRFVLLGQSQGCAIAIAYAARHPEQVSHLILHGGYVLGKLKRELTSQQREEAHTLIKLIELGWGKESPEFRQVFTTQLIPDAPQEVQRAFDEYQRMSASPDTAARIIRECDQIDVRALAGQVRCPTLVLHARHDGRVPFEEGRRMAALIPGARFVPLETRNHALPESDPAWRLFVDEVIRFPQEPTAEAPSGPFARQVSVLTAREREVLELVAQGQDNAYIARALALSEKTVRNYVTIIFDKLQLTNRAQVIVSAREAGFGKLPPSR